MSQSPNVIVAIGEHTSPSLPKQNYSNLFTEFNIPVALTTQSNSTFFNRIANNTTHDSIPEDIEIYGFMEGAWKFTHDNSVQQIVNFFQQYSQIGIVICDVVIDKGSYQAQQYIQPFSFKNNIPFFIRKSIVSQINFLEEPNYIYQQLKKLQKQHVIFHIAEPLLSINIQGHE